MGNYLGRAAAYSMHKKYPTGSQTASQLRAERSNLIKARLARGQARNTGSARYHALRISNMRSRGTAGAERVYRMRDINNFKKRPLGSRIVRYRSTASLKKPRITGISKKFVGRLSSGRYLGRTQWGSARTHKFRKHLIVRQHRFKQIKKWKQRGKRFTPR